MPREEPPGESPKSESPSQLSPAAGGASEQRTSPKSLRSQGGELYRASKSSTQLKRRTIKRNPLQSFFKENDFRCGDQCVECGVVFTTGIGLGARRVRRQWMLPRSQIAHANLCYQHHCRHCGRSFCDLHCPKRVIVRSNVLSGPPSRLCQKCYSEARGLYVLRPEHSQALLSFDPNSLFDAQN